MDWPSLWIGIIGSLLATLILAIIARANGWVQFAWRSWSKSRDVSQRIESAGIVNFYLSRDDYGKFRGAPRLLDYLAKAQKTIHVASHWMAHGVEMEGIVLGLTDLVRPPKKLTVTVGVIDPTASYVRGLADFFNIAEAELVQRTQAALIKLHEARNGLSAEERTRFIIKVYTAIPVASVIILDSQLPTGRLQIDIKAYKVPRHDSFGFELSGSDRALYTRCRDAWVKLLDDSPRFNPQNHLPRDVA